MFNESGAGKKRNEKCLLAEVVDVDAESQECLQTGGVACRLFAACNSGMDTEATPVG